MKKIIERGNGKTIGKIEDEKGEIIWSAELPGDEFDEMNAWMDEFLVKK